MMRNLLLFAISFCMVPSAQAFDREKLMDAFNSIVMIRGYNDKGGMAYGSGVVVATNKVMTNCHIFRQTKQPWVSRGEDSYAVVSVQADRYHDLCLVETNNLPLKPVAIGSSAVLKKGQEVVAIGHSSGVPAPLTSVGTLKSIYPYQNNGNVIRTNARFAMGASGSGLFDGHGRLIGINTFKTPGRVAFFYALPVEWLDDLEKLPVETIFPVAGKAFWEEEDENKPFFMQMALPEIKRDWPKLGQVAEKWIKAEPNNSEAWYELGHAQENMGRTDEAETAYNKAIEISPSNSDALFRIGVLANEKGDKEKVDKINLALLDLDKEASEEFLKVINCKTDCPTN